MYNPTMARYDTFTNLISIPVDLARGDFVSAELSAIGAIPDVGEVGDAAKLARTADKAVDAAKATKKIQKTIKNPIVKANRVGSALKIDKYHNFTNIVDNYANSAKNFKLKGGDGKIDLLLSEEDYPIDDEVEKMVQQAVSNSKSKMHTLSIITQQQNKAINRLALKESNDFFRGKFTGGKHLVSDYAIKHAVAEHGDFLREALRAQLPITTEDIARHLSAVKDDKTPSNIKASRTRQGNASVITSYEVNGYTLYAEEITKSLGQNAPSDLIGHTMYKAPTLSTAAAPATSAGALPKRQSMVLCEYYTTNGNNLSSGEFVADVNGKPAKLYFILQNNIPKADTLLGGLVALSSNSDNFTDKSASIGYGYVVCKKPYYITVNNRVFSNSKTDVSQSINELKKQGYDCFIFDKVVGDNYMVAVVNKAQIVENEPDILLSENDYAPTFYSHMGKTIDEMKQDKDIVSGKRKFEW